MTAPDRRCKLAPQLRVGQLRAVCECRHVHNMHNTCVMLCHHIGSQPWKLRCTQLHGWLCAQPLPPSDFLEHWGPGSSKIIGVGNVAWSPQDGAPALNCSRLTHSEQGHSRTVSTGSDQIWHWPRSAHFGSVSGIWPDLGQNITRYCSG